MVAIAKILIIDDNPKYLAIISNTTGHDIVLTPDKSILIFKLYKLAIITLYFSYCNNDSALFLIFWLSSTLSPDTHYICPNNTAYSLKTYLIFYLSFLFWILYGYEKPAFLLNNIFFCFPSEPSSLKWVLHNIKKLSRLKN